MISSRYSEDSNLYSGLESLSSDYTEFKTPAPNRPGNQRPVAQPSRRQSRLLYAEKYGLNSSPEWQGPSSIATTATSATTTTKADTIDDDDRPLSLQPRSNSISTAITTSRHRRPQSIFNLSTSSTTTLRPAAFVKPTTTATTTGQSSTVPNDMMSIQQLYEQYQKKVYMEGFVFKRNKFNTDGSVCQDQWTKLYVELSGPVLSLWDDRKPSNSSGMMVDSILPHYINITDATVSLVSNGNGNSNSNSNNPNGGNNPVLVMLNTAGRNQYLIRPDPPTLPAAQRWVLAIRLSCFECARLYELYSRRLLLRPMYKHLLDDSTNQQRRRTEGFIQARFAGDTEWKKYWAVASDQRDEKRLFGKTRSVPCRSQLMFYQTKKSKYPSVTLVNIVYAYTLYPQSPRMIDMSTIFKVEGTTLTTTDLKSGEQNMTHSSAGTLLMATSPMEMMQWLVGISNVFKLYGRPHSLLDDPLDPKALNFGESATLSTTTNSPSGDGSRLFLDFPDVMHLPVGQDETLLDSKLVFTNVLLEKLKSGSNKPAASSASAAKPLLYAAKPRANSAPLLADIAPPSDYTLNKHNTSTVKHSSSMATIPSERPHPAQRRSMLALSQSHTAMVYASDDSDEDNDESDDDQSDGDSLFINTTMPQLVPLKSDNGTTDTNNKESCSSPDPIIPSPIPSTSTHSSAESNKVLSPEDDYQDNNMDMMGFANSLLSKSFGMDSSTTSFNPIIPAPEALPPRRTVTPSPTLRSATIIDGITTPSASTSITEKQPPLTKRMSVLPLPSDGEDSDHGATDSKTEEEEDDEPLRDRHVNPMKPMLAGSSYPTGRPLSTALSATTTPATTISNPSSAATGSDASSSNTSTSSGPQPYHRKMKQQQQQQQQRSMKPSTGAPKPRYQQSRPASSLGLVHKIDSMQQQIQQQQQQQQQEQQSLWETGSLMGTDPRIASYQYRPQQQQQQQQPIHQQQQQPLSWEDGSMTGSVSGVDPRIAMYRRAGSMYGNSSLGGGNGSVYGSHINESIYSGNGGGSVYGGSVYGGSVYGGSAYGGDDYQKMMAPQTLVQMDSKPGEPRAGLIGVISQLEDEKRDKDKKRLSTTMSSPQPQVPQYQDQLMYQQQLLQQQMMMNNPYMMNSMMMNPMMMNPMMMNPMMVNPMMVNPMAMMQQQQWPPMSPSGSFYSPPLMEQDNEDDDAPLARPTMTTTHSNEEPTAKSRNRRRSSGRY